MRIAIYARVSTGEQTSDPQVWRARAYCEARGFEIVGEFVDHGVSGARARRPQLDRMLELVRARGVDAVVTVKLDRLARSVQHLVSLASDFAALRVDLIATDQAIDTTTPTGRLLFHVLAAIAEFERDLIRERTRAGLEAARRKGKRLGRPCALDPEKRKRLERMLGAGQSQRHIARVLGIGQGTVRRELKRLGRDA